VIPRILLKAKTVLRDEIPINAHSHIYRSQSKKLPLNDASVDFILTSPPFLGVINYIDDNWLRFWFLGYNREKLRKVLIQTNNLEEYKQFLLVSMKEMHRVLKPNKTCVVEVGDVNHKSKKVMLDHLIVELADEAGFNVEKILINHFDAPKISKAFGRNFHGTKTNRCVIMKRK